MRELTDLENEAQLQAIGIPEQREESLTLNRVDLLELAMLTAIDDSVLAYVEIEPEHRFANGIYTREVTIPAGTILTGRIHKTQHICVVSKGRIRVWSEEFGLQEIRAPYSFVSSIGTRRVGYAMTDTVWTTVHANPKNITDIEELERELFADNRVITNKDLKRLKGST